MKKHSLVISVMVAVAVAFSFAVCFATDAPETIPMESKVFDKHTKGIVTFSHKKHAADYKVACADCHHVIQDGKNVWKEGDKVEKCVACHKEAKAPKGEKMEKKEKIAKYYYDAIHTNCVDCHKAEKKAGKNAPAACKECHGGAE